MRSDRRGRASLGDETAERVGVAGERPEDCDGNFAFRHGQRFTALDGYLKVFWRNAAVWGLWPQALVLAVSSMVFMAAARLLARRWETA